MTIDDTILAATILILALVVGIVCAELKWRQTCQQKEDREMQKHIKSHYKEDLQK